VLTRLRDVTVQRRGLAAGAVAALGVSACVGLVAVDGHDFGSDPERVTAGSFPQARQGTTYPDAAALETMSSERNDRPTDRGDARTSPSDKVSQSALPEPEPTRSEASNTPAPAAPETSDADGGNDGGSQPRQTEQPEPSDTPEPSPTPEETSPPPPPPPAPETTAVTDLSAAGTWTVVLSSDRATSFECSLDGGAWTACGPVATFTGLSKGRHTLAVRAVDGAGTADPSPAQLSTTVNGPLL
jgi:hypothetical protein